MSRKRYQRGSVRERGKNVQTQYWEGTWREYVRGQAKPQRRSNLLRPWFGTTLAEGGVPLKTLPEQMGHASIATTMRHCVHAQEESRRQAARVIGRALGQSTKGEESESNPSNFGDIIDDMEGELVGVPHANR